MILKIILYIIFVFPTICYSDDYNYETVNITAYTLSIKENKQQKPHIGAFNTKIQIGDCAVSHDLYKSGWVQNLYIVDEKNNIYRINDLMSPRKKKSVDILVKNKRIAFKYGKKRNVKVFLITSNKENKENKKYENDKKSIFEID